MKWIDINTLPKKGDVMVLVVRKFGGFYLKDYAYYNNGKFRHPYNCLVHGCKDEVYNNVVLWRYLPKLPKELRKKEL